MLETLQASFAVIVLLVLVVLAPVVTGAIIIYRAVRAGRQRKQQNRALPGMGRRP